MAMRDVDAKDEHKRTVYQSINRRSSDFNKFEIPLTDASLQKNECSETSIVKWQSYTPSNGQQEAKLSQFNSLNFAKQNTW